MIPQIESAAVRAGDAALVPSAPLRAALAVGAAFRRWRLRVETRATLAALSPDQLKDLGLEAPTTPSLHVDARLIAGLNSMR